MNQQQSSSQKQYGVKFAPGLHPEQIRRMMQEQVVKQQTAKPEAQVYLDRLDHLVDQPHSTKRDEQYVDALIAFVLDRPEEGLAFAREFFPRADKPTIPTVPTVSAVEQFFRELYPTACFAPFPSSEDPNSVEAVSHWLNTAVLPAANLAWLMTVHEKAVFAGIWSLLKGQDDLAEDGDLSREVDYIACQVWAWVADNLESLFTEGTATVTTRIHAKAWAFARTWKTQRIRHKARYVKVDADLIDKKLIVQAERKRTSRLIDDAKIKANPPITRAMLCPACGTVQAVSSASGELFTLLCGHSRGLSIMPQNDTPNREK